MLLQETVAAAVIFIMYSFIAQMTSMKLKIVTEQRRKRRHDGSVVFNATAITSDSAVVTADFSQQHSPKMEKIDTST